MTFVTVPMIFAFNNTLNLFLHDKKPFGHVKFEVKIP